MRRLLAAMCFVLFGCLTLPATPVSADPISTFLFGKAAGVSKHKATKVRKAHKRQAQRRHGAALPVANRSLVGTAQAYMGRTAAQLGLRRTLWCAAFMNKVLRKLGHRGTGSDMARSFARYGRRVSGPMVGAIAVMSRGRRGGHVGVVAGLCHRGVEVISGNHGRRVGRGCYPRSRIYAYVLPPARMASR